MDTEKTCPACRRSLPANSPQGLCPECLMKGGLGSRAEVGADTTASDLEGLRDKRFVPPTVDEIARFFPQLEVLAFVGQGGMGAVYKARQKQLDRVVALKILPPDIGEDAAFAERFTREAKAMAKLSHPGIVTIHDFGQTDGLFYFLMEFVDGVTLWQLLDAQRVSPREALAIVPQICDALQYAHDAGIVHRDIKPENILLDRSGRVKVADFGLAKLVEVGGEAAAESGAAADAPALTGAGKVMGTPQYMAPEQRERPQDVDHRADIYSLGVVFYQLLTGELPNRPIEPPSKRVQIDVRLDEVVMRTLEKEPQRRYQRASALKTQVETIASTPSAQGQSRSKTEATADDPDRKVVSPASGRSLPVLTGVFFLLPPAVLLWFLVAGHQTLGVDLDGDVQLPAGLLGLPLSAGVGVVLAWVIELFRSSSGLASDETGAATPQRWCWQAILGAALLVVSLPVGGASIAVVHLMGLETEGWRGWNPGPSELVVTLLLFGVTVLTAAAATLLGIEALRRIRRPSEPLRGRFGALAAAWFWPCMLVVLAVSLPLGKSAHQQEAEAIHGQLREEIAQFERDAEAERAEKRALLPREEQTPIPLANPATEPKQRGGTGQDAAPVAANVSPSPSFDFFLGMRDGPTNAARGFDASGQVAGAEPKVNTAQVGQDLSAPNAASVSLVPAYQVTDLGTLGGPISLAHDINASGQVVGAADTASGNRHAFLYADGKMTDLGALCGPDVAFSEARGINAGGQVVGCYDTGSRERHAFLFDNGKMTDLGGLFGAASSSHAYRINAGGQVVGASLSRAFLYSNGKMLDLGTSGRPLRSKKTYLSNPKQLYIASEAYGVNDRGDVVGYARGPGSTARQTRAFLYRSGEVTEIGFLPGGSWSLACDINDSGQVVGYADTANGDTHAFLYADGKMIDLGTLGGAESWAKDINAAGQIVGCADTAGGSRHAYLYSNGKMTDLNTLCDPAPDCVLADATAINDAGLIAGRGEAPGKKSRAILLTPVIDVDAPRQRK